MSALRVRMLAAARDQVSALPFDDGAEIAAGLFGWRQGDALVISALIPNREEGTRAGVHLELNRWMHWDGPSHRLLGDLHTHLEVTEPRARPSIPDTEAWATFARQLQQSWVGVIVHPRREAWWGGEPAGFDWCDPRLSAWIAAPSGGVTEARLSVQPHWMAELEAQLRFDDEREEIARGIT